MKMDITSWILLFASLFCVSATSSTLKIKQLRVPDIVDLSSHDSAILDCDYTVNNTDGLVVKWFFRNNPIPVYQWIMSRKPQSFGVLKDRLDLDYNASNNEETKYRALRIKTLSLELTGDYKCVVSTFIEEDTMTKRMVILEPPKHIDIMQVRLNESSIQIICTVQGIAPKPDLNIEFTESIIMEEQELVEMKTEDGLYNITKLITLKEKSLGEEENFTCNISIPNTRYSKEEKLTYFRENSGALVYPAKWLCILYLLFWIPMWT